MSERDRIINNYIMPGFLSALEAAGIFVEVVDKDGVYMYCSKDTGEFNYSPLATVGKKVTDVLAETYNMKEKNVSALMQTLKYQTPIRNAYFSFLSVDGKDSYWLLDTSPILVQGELLGAICLSKPFHKVRQAIENANDNKRFLMNGLSKPANKMIYSFDNILYKSDVMQETIDTAKQISLNHSSVLLTGETGTGKELFAQSIHQHGPRKEKPFVAINCNAIPNNLLESTLFGTSRGAFTGAIQKGGLFEEANKGTLFLDEINSMDMNMQTKLLRAIETKRIRRVGSSNEIPIDVRIISATNADLMECIAKKTMREDLFYRLAVATLEIPPLRERKGDALFLANYFINKLGSVYNKRVHAIAADVEDIFTHSLWPGNVRELQHVIEHAINVVSAEETTLRKQHLPFYFLQQFGGDNLPSLPVGDYKLARAQALHEWDRQFTGNYIRNALNECHNNISLAAKKMNISRRHLYNLMEKYHMNCERP